jgi:quinol monooxygenase YgiN
MITLIFRAKMKAGKEDEALAKMRGMVESVQASEPGVLTYAFHRVQDDPSELVFWEAYADDEAFKAHAGTPHMGEMRSFFGELFDTTTVKLERMERVAGFVRAG